MGSYAVVNGGVVINVVAWDGKADWSPDTGEVVETNNPVAIGWSYSDGVFSPPPVPQPSRAELVASAEQEQSSLLEIATAKIVIWQTKLLAGRKLTTSETTQLNAWLDYIDAVTAVDTSTAPDIDWPVTPGGE